MAKDKQPKEVYTPQQFAKAYQGLCDKMGYRINVNPAWIARDDGSWSLVLQTSVGKLPELTSKK